MSKITMKRLLTLLIIIYVLSPIDAAPGPIDDMLVIVLGEMLKRRLPEGV